jgi:addiction module HigA family antidote
MDKNLPPITPGEILLEEFLRPSGMSQSKLARAVGVPPGRINDIVRGKRGITPDTASRLAVYWGTSPDLWINLQARYDAKNCRSRSGSSDRKANSDAYAERGLNRPNANGS